MLKLAALSSMPRVYRNDANRALKAIQKRGLKLDALFLDPPYKKQQLLSLLTEIDTIEIMNSNAFILCEHGSDVELPERIGKLQQIKREKYGIINITIYEIDFLSE